MNILFNEELNNFRVLFWTKKLKNGFLWEKERISNRDEIISPKKKGKHNQNKRQKINLHLILSVSQQPWYAFNLAQTHGTNASFIH